MKSFLEFYDIDEEIKAFHGSPHKFEVFSLDAIGKGEGHQSFGWGLYFTDNKDIAQYYADNVKDMPGVLKINDELSRLAKEMDKYKIHGEWRKFKDPKGYEFQKQYDDLMDQREHLVNKPGEIYRVTLHKGKLPNQYDYLQWDDKATDKQLAKINKEANKEGIEQLGKVKNPPINYKSKYAIPEVIRAGKTQAWANEDILLQIKNDGEAYDALMKRFPELKDKEDWAEIVTRDVFGRFSSAKSINNLDTHGAGLYSKIAQILGSEKEASMFLLRAGISGIEYPAGTMTPTGITIGNNKARNYVVFDPKEVTIEKEPV